MKINHLLSVISGGRLYVLSCMLALTAGVANAADVIEVPLCSGDATHTLQQAIDKAAGYRGKPVTIRLSPGNYNISHDNASLYPYHVSNTASVEEDPDCTKHIGLWFKDLKNVTLDGNGAWLVTHGEMTSFAIDSCANITIKNLTLTAADPSVPELKVVAVDRNTMTADITEPSRFEISPEGRFSFVGEGWRCADGHHETQVFYPESNVTLRCESPLKGCLRAQSLGGKRVQFFYNNAPGVHVGEVYQLRHGVRNEVCTLINCSKDVTLQNIEFNFLGNFGLVGQFSRNITYDDIRCRPRLGSERTDAGFADFVQLSGCSGKVAIRNSYFEGAHDDPINIHGTHLKAIGSQGDKRLTVRFMHGQSFGFQPFFKGDSVEIVDRHTLNCLSSAKVRDVQRLNDYEFELYLDRSLPALPQDYTIEDVAVENVTHTPEVEITGNYFARIPTRGILITTRRKSLIQDNIFYRMPMPAILVSDDARGWYESGPVRDLTIRRNTFIECGSPVIDINPEIDRFDRPVHSGIVIEDNRFIMKEGTKAIRLRAADNVIVRNNVFDLPPHDRQTIGTLIEQENTSNIVIDNNLQYENQ